MNEATLNNMTAEELLSYCEKYDGILLRAVCRKLRQAVEKLGAEGVTVETLDPDVNALKLELNTALHTNKALTEQLEVLLNSFTVNARDTKNILTKHKL